MDEENNTEDTPVREKPEVPSVIVNRLTSQFWCDFHNACRSQKRKKVKKLLNGIIDAVDDTYIADVQIGHPSHEPQDVTFNLFSFTDEPPLELYDLCEWLSDDRIKINFSWFVYAASSDGRFQMDDDIPDGMIDDGMFFEDIENISEEDRQEIEEANKVAVTRWVERP